MDSSDCDRDWSASWRWPRKEIYSSSASLVERATQGELSVVIKKMLHLDRSRRYRADLIAFEEKALRDSVHPHVVRLLDARGAIRCS